MEPQPSTPTPCEVCKANCLDEYNWHSYYIWTEWAKYQKKCDLIQNPVLWGECIAKNQKWLLKMLKELNADYDFCQSDCQSLYGITDCSWDSTAELPPYYWEPMDIPTVPPETPPRTLPDWWEPR